MISFRRLMEQWFNDNKPKPIFDNFGNRFHFRLTKDWLVMGRNKLENSRIKKGLRTELKTL